MLRAIMLRKNGTANIKRATASVTISSRSVNPRTPVVPI